MMPKLTATAIVLLSICLAAGVQGIEVSGLIERDTTWTADDIIEVVDNVQIDSAATLTIDAGTEIRFHWSTSLRVHGALIANGTDLEPISITSAANPDTLYYYRMWYGIDAESSRRVNLVHCHLSWAVTAVSTNRTNLSMTDCRVENFASSGVSMSNPSETSVDSLRLQRCTIQQTSPDLIGKGIGVRVYRAADVRVSECRIRDCLRGIALHGYRPFVPHADIQLCEFARCDSCCINFTSGYG